MKRTLSLVLALVMLLGTIPVFAADTAAEQAAFLEEMGVLKGNTAGDLMLAQELKREDSVVMLARLLGLEAAAEAWEGAPTWTDLPENPYYVSFLAWAQEEGYYKGHSDLRFGFGETITANDFALVLWRALGYEDPAVWTDAFDAAVELGLLEGLDLEGTDKLLRGDMAVMVYLALGTEMAEGGKTLAEVLGVEMPVVAMEVEATGAKELTVTFNKAVEGATFAVKKGTVNVNIDGTPVMAEDGKSAVITLVSNMTKGDYTVVATGASEEALEATVTVEDVKVSAINLVSAKAPMVDNTYKQAKFQFEVLNQYGERMPNISINWTASTGDNQAVATGSNGVGTMTLNAPGSTTFLPNSAVYLTGVYTGNGTVLNGQVEIVLPAHVDEIVFKGVEKGGKFVALPSDFADATYTLLFSAKDQYGNNFTLVDTAAPSGEWDDVVFVSNNPGFVASTFTATSKTVDGVTYQGIELDRGTNVAAGGSVTIQAISARTGKVSTYTLTADAKATLKTFTMSAPTDLVAAGDGYVEVPFTAVDQFNNALTKHDDIAGKVTLSPESNGTTVGLYFSKQADGTTKLLYNVPTTAAADTPVYLTSVVTAGGSFSSVNFTVRKTATATAVVGLNSKIISTVAAGNSVTVKGSDVLVQDQYGRTMNNAALSNFPAAKIVVTANSGAFALTTTGTDLTTGTAIKFELDAADETVMLNTVGGSTATTQTLTFAIDGVVGSARNVTFTKVAQSSFVSYEVADPGLVYANAGHTTSLTVYGVLANGTKVAVPAANIKVSSSYLTYNAGTLTVTTTSGLSLTDSSTNLPKNDTKKIVVTVEDLNTNAALAILEQDVVFSGVAPKATTLTLSSKVVNGSALVQATGTTTSSAISTAELVGFITKVVDQYGDPMGNTPSITVTNLVKVSTTSNFKVNNNQSTTADIQNPSVGDNVTVTYNYAGGKTETINFTVGEYK